MLEDAAQSFVDGLSRLMKEYNQAAAVAVAKRSSKLEQAEAIKAAADAEYATFARNLNIEYAGKIRELGEDCKSKAEHPEDMDGAISFSANFLGGVMKDTVFPTDPENARIRMEHAVTERERREAYEEENSKQIGFAPDWWRGATIGRNYISYF